MPAHHSLQKKPSERLTESQQASQRQTPASSMAAFGELQQLLGNRAVGHMMVPAVQAKLTVGPEGDSFEQEADRVGKAVAEQISGMSGGAPAPLQRMGGQEEEELQLKRASEGIQRAAIGEEEELQLKRASEGIQRAAIGEEEELQLKRSDAAFDAAPSVESGINQKKGSGPKLDGQIQAKMEAAFGSDFSDVSVHHDAESDQLNRSVGALAFTQGNDIFFRQGQYNPGSREGQELLGHELTHVVQQTGGK